jgi:hypothetical protein
MFPAIIDWLGRGELSRPGYASLAVGLLLVLGGALVIWCALIKRRETSLSIPAPVRAVMAANVLLLAFCALETSDGLVYRGGRLFYWTSFLFAPALAVLYGHALAQRWAWWVARALTVIAALWFLTFIAILPFADVRGASGPAPWYGRLYMAAVSLAFAAIAAYAFHSLGHDDARRYFTSARQA